MYVIIAFDIVVFAWLYVAVSKAEIARERTATEEMWARPLDFYKHETRRGVTAAPGNSSRIAESPATTNSNAEVRV